MSNEFDDAVNKAVRDRAAKQEAAKREALEFSANQDRIASAVRKWDAEVLQPLCEQVDKSLQKDGGNLRSMSSMLGNWTLTLSRGGRYKSIEISLGPTGVLIARGDRNQDSLGDPSDLAVSKVKLTNVLKQAIGEVLG